MFAPLAQVMLALRANDAVPGGTVMFCGDAAK